MSAKELIECIAKKDLELLKTFIAEKSPDLNGDSNAIAIPINMAVHYGNLDVFSYLIEQGCDVNNCDKKGETPLMYACVKGNIEIAKMLISKECDVNIQSNSGMSAFLVACKSGKIDLINLLIEHGADIQVMTDDNKNAFYFATTVETVTLLHEKNVALNIVDNDGLSPILLSAKNGHYPKFKYILEHINNYDPNEATKNGETAILLCAESQLYQQELIVSDLIKLGADVNKKNKYGMSPLHNCASNNHIKIATVLLEYVDEVDKSLKVDMNVTEPCFGNTPLQLASANGHLDMVKLLVEKGANINFVNPKGLTALDSARKACVVNQDIISFLLSNGAISGSDEANLKAKEELDGIKLVVETASNHIYEETVVTNTSQSKKKSRCILM